jgi:AcrR family transcriptional regulator
MTPATAPRTQQQRSEATIGDLLAAARDLFGSQGYAATSLDDVARRAAVSKGALYHHFAGKPEVFRAVFVKEQEALAATVIAASRRKREPWEAFFAGCRAFLEASLDPVVQQITLMDAPAVLGWREMRELEAPHSFAVLRAGIAQAVDDGRLAGRDATVLSHLVMGAMCEAVALAAGADSPQRVMRRVIAELRALLAQR